MHLRAWIARQNFLALLAVASAGFFAPSAPLRAEPQLYDTSLRFRLADGSYTPERHALHDKIEKQLLAEGRTSDRPMLLFLAGAPGAGKSTIVPVLESAGFIEPRGYLVIDSDRIKDSIPEYPVFQKLNQVQAAHAVHTESTDIAREAFHKALAARKNIIVDGTLRNAASWEAAIRQVRQEHPEYAIGTVFIDAELDTLIHRVAEREKRTGRNVEVDYLVDTRKAVRASINRLEPLVDVSVEIENENAPKVLHALRNGQLVAQNLILPRPGQMHRRAMLGQLPEHAVSATQQVKLAIFDADQTLRVASSGEFYPTNASDVLLLPFVGDKVAELERQGYVVVVTSNQSEISRGQVPLAVADQALFFTAQMLKVRGAHVAYYDFAENRDGDRKPEPGMARRLEELLSERDPPLTVDWASSVVVGDAGYTAAEPAPGGGHGSDFSDSDRLFAERLGAKFIEARTFFGWKDYGITGFKTKRDVVDFALAHPELKIETESDCEILLRH